MTKYIYIILFIGVCSISYSQGNEKIKIGLLKYSGGGDWYANKPSSLPNLIQFCNDNINTNIYPESFDIDAGSQDIFNYPFIHMTGHGNVLFSKQEQENIRRYLLSGGFLHIDDNYGMDKYIRRELKKLFPNIELVELPYTHVIFHQKYNFPNGLPKIHEHDNKRPQGFGIIYKGRLICFYSYECDLGDGWESEEIHHDSQAKRIKALQMGANIINYVFEK